MKGAIIATSDPKFVDNTALALRKLGYDVSLQEETLQLSDNGQMLTLYGNAHDLRELVPDLDSIENRELLDGKGFGYLVDCRWEDLFCRVMRELAGSRVEVFFIIDNAGAVLDPTKLDPARIYL